MRLAAFSVLLSVKRRNAKFGGTVEAVSKSESTCIVAHVPPKSTLAAAPNVTRSALAAPETLALLPVAVSEMCEPLHVPPVATLTLFMVPTARNASPDPPAPLK